MGSPDPETKAVFGWVLSLAGQALAMTTPTMIVLDMGWFARLHALEFSVDETTKASAVWSVALCQIIWDFNVSLQAPKRGKTSWWPGPD